MVRRRDRGVAECMRLWMDYILMNSRRDQLSLHAALAGCDLNVRVLEIDNKVSPYHEWIPVSEIGRKISVQA